MCVCVCRYVDGCINTQISMHFGSSSIYVCVRMSKSTFNADINTLKSRHLNTLTSQHLDTSTLYISSTFHISSTLHTSSTPYTSSTPSLHPPRINGLFTELLVHPKGLVNSKMNILNKLNTFLT